MSVFPRMSCLSNAILPKCKCRGTAVQTLQLFIFSKMVYFQFFFLFGKGQKNTLQQFMNTDDLLFFF